MTTTIWQTALAWATALTACAVALAQEQRVVRPAAVQTAEVALKTMRDRVNALPRLGRFRLEDLVRLRVVGGALRAEFSSAVRVMAEHRLEVEGSPAVWTVRSYPVAAGRTSEYVILTRYDFDEAAAGGIWSASLRTTAQGTSVYAQVGYGAQAAPVSLYCTGGQIRLTAARRSIGGMLPTLWDFRCHHPVEYRAHLLPVFRKIVGGDPLQVKAADAYRAFPQIQPDPRVQQQVRRLLPSLDSPVPAEREQASTALARLGAPAVLVILRMDRTPLSPEQANRLDQLLALHDEGRCIRAEDARRDRLFLIDCLEFDDPRVRRAARPALEQLLRQPLAFDPGTVQDQPLALAVDKLRTIAATLPPVRPSTRPATQPLRPLPVN